MKAENLYIGVARNNSELKEAIRLSATVFRHEATENEAIIIKERFLSPESRLKKKEVITIIRGTKVLGCCFMISRQFFLGDDIIHGMYLSSICISENHRGEGLSIKLINAALNESKKRGAAFAVLIARKAVDYFYNKLNFWGVSQYSKIEIRLPEKITTNRQAIVETASSEHLEKINLIYENVYKNLYGASARSLNYWNYILWKLNLYKLSFSILIIDGQVEAYCIYSNDEIFELAALNDSVYMEFLIRLKPFSENNSIVVNLPETHPVIHEMVNLDIRITTRQCNFGGHMVRVLNQECLSGFLKKDILKRTKFYGINQMHYNHFGNEIIINKNKISLRLNGLATDFHNTCFLMNIKTLTNISQALPLNNCRPFNIPLMDQI